MAGALDGIKVLDFSEMIAAPVAGMLLAGAHRTRLLPDPCDAPRHAKVLRGSGQACSGANSAVL
jgi:hypothetical protein